MPQKAYLSNLTWHPISTQMAALVALTGTITFYKDELNPRQKRGAYFEHLCERAAMLRPTTRQTGDEIHMMSLAALAREETDFRRVYRLIVSRRGSINVVETGSVWNKLGQIDKAVAEWKTSRGTSARKGAAIIAGLASGAKAKARTKEGIEKIRHLWPLPSSEYNIKELEALSGVSRGSIVSVLGNRTIAQVNHQAALKRKAQRARAA